MDRASRWLDIYLYEIKEDISLALESDPEIMDWRRAVRFFVEPGLPGQARPARRRAVALDRMMEGRIEATPCLGDRAAKKRKAARTRRAAFRCW
jgi:hypothetical protein